MIICNYGKTLYKCIKQLNILFKKKAPIKEIELWEQAYITFSEELNDTRKVFFRKIHNNIMELSCLLQEEIRGLSISFKQGWGKEITLAQQLKLR